MAFAPGQQVTQSLRLVRQLGKGGMGEVWVAQHLALETEVAIKFISPEVADRDPTLTGRFKREASLAAKIKSPHVVQMLDYGLMLDGTPFIVMEKLEGESLGQYLERDCLLDLERTATMLDQTGKALDKAHAVGVVHRDLKPDNLFWVDSGYDMFIKVLDFGIAKSTAVTAQPTVVTESTAVAGTPQFMSPEQLLSTKNVDGRTDLWALGVITYLCLTGRYPFNADTLAGLTLAICMEDFTPASQHRPTLPAQLDAWFARALAKEPGRRFATAGELAVAFERARNGEPLDPPTARVAPTAHGSCPEIGPPNHPTRPGFAGVEGAPALARAAAAHTLLSGDPSFAGHPQPDLKPETFQGAAAEIRPTTERRSGVVVGVGAFLVVLVAIGVGAWRTGLLEAKVTASTSTAVSPPPRASASHSVAVAEASATADPPAAASQAPTSAPSVAGIATPGRWPVTDTRQPIVSADPPPPKATGRPAYCDGPGAYYKLPNGQEDIRPQCLP